VESVDANAGSRNPAYIHEYLAKVGFAVDRGHETSPYFANTWD
jgi:hypothetical protein